MAVPYARLQDAVEGSVIDVDNERYEWARKSLLARYDVIRPQAVVRCTSAGDVAATVDFARIHGVAVAARSGGHCFAGHSSTEGIVIDVSPMGGIVVGGGLVHTGTGLRLGLINRFLFAHGLTIPTGSYSSVGIAGTTLGGGLGVLGRKFGLTCDHLVSVELVLADGSVVTCDDEHDADLFWAMRGAGKGNFGVATSFVFRPQPAPDMMNFYLVWPISQGVTVTDVWQRRAPFARDDVAAGLAHSATPGADDAIVVELYGAIAGSADVAYAMQDDFVAKVVGMDPVSSSIEPPTYKGTAEYQAELLAAANQQVEPSPGVTVDRQGPRWIKSEFLIDCFRWMRPPLLIG